MRTLIISLQVALIAMLAISGALASAKDKPACPLGNEPPALHCEK